MIRMQSHQDAYLDEEPESRAPARDHGCGAAVTGSDAAAEMLELQARLQKITERLQETAREERRRERQEYELSGRESVHGFVQEMRSMREAIERLASVEKSVDVSEVTRSIEDGYAEIARMLESPQAVNAGRSDSRDAVAAEIAVLADHVATMRDTIDRLPEKLPAAAFEARLEEIGRAITLLLDAGESSISRNFAAIDGRLDELTRAMLAVSAGPSASQDALDRLEDGLAGLARMVVQIVEREIQTPTDTPMNDLSDLPAEIGAVAQRLEADIDAAAREDESEVDALRQLAVQIAGLEDRFDAFAAGTGDSCGGDRISKALDGLANRIETLAVGIERIGGGRVDVADQLRSLEAQLGAIATRLGEQPTILEKAAEIANDAAERALQLHEGPRQNSLNGEDAELAQVQSELRLIAERTHQAERNDSARLTAILDKLDSIAELLYRPTAHLDPRRPAEGALSEVSAGRSSVSSDRVEDDTTHDEAGLESLRALGNDQPQPARGAWFDYDLDEYDHDVGSARGEPTETPPSAGEERGEEDPPIEDVPLEPGSGVPDLNALLRQASARRSSIRGESGHPRPQDYLAAARRAAQAASQDIQNRSAVQAADVKRPSSRLAALVDMIQRRRQSIVAVGFIAIATAMAAPAALYSFERVDRHTGLEAPAGAQSGQLPESRNLLATQSPAIAGRSVENGPEPVIRPTRGSANYGAPTLPEEIGNAAIRQAAARGDPAATFEIGRRYVEGDRVERDFAAARRWLEQAARSGLAPAQFRLAQLHESGDGAPVDLGRALSWYGKAAEQGHVLAMHNLAVLHTSGLLGGKPDMLSAVRWFRMAAERGVVDSQVNLGIIYARALGVETDLSVSYRWFAIAARNGDADATAKRDAIAAALGDEALALARAEAEAWAPAPINEAANSVPIRPNWRSAKASHTLAPEAVRYGDEPRMAEPARGPAIGRDPVENASVQ
jgi:localization factor PodJL